MSDIPNGVNAGDALAWARCFEDTKRQNAWTLDQIDEALMLGWFANAIESATDYRLGTLIAERDALKAEVERLRRERALHWRRLIKRVVYWIETPNE